MKNKFFCLHAHFDLPPQDSPWLDTPDPDPSAAPYPDAYSRMLHTCAGPNTASPLLDEEGRILKFVNNLAHLSFDFAPHWLTWIERTFPRVYERILEADRLSREQHAGHGSAIAAASPALILPLESAANKRTAIRWGMHDFRRRFGREAEGFWLPENAADAGTLEALIDAGIRFTLLSPAQAAQVRPAGSTADKDWLEVVPDTLDTTRPYRWISPADPARRLAVFFYRLNLDPARIYAKLPLAVSTPEPLKTAREQVIDVGQRFANRLVDSLTANDARELSHAAIDGELFGHLRLNGNRALTYALDTLLREAPARWTNYGEYLDNVPPPQEVRLHPLSSRSCPHGVQRWSGDCGCGELPPAAPWRAPLREALEALGRDLDERYWELGKPLFWDAAEARDAYGALITAPPGTRTAGFLDEQTAKHLTPQEARTALRLCEMQRWRLRMLEHWAWQEDDPAAATGLRILACAGKALHVLSLIDDTAQELEKGFIERLARCPSKETTGPNAAEIYNRIVRPARADARRALAHYAVSDHMEAGPMPNAGLGLPGRRAATSFTAGIEPLLRRTRRAGRGMNSLAVCRIGVRQPWTFEQAQGLTAVFHSQDADIECWTREEHDTDRDRRIAAELDRAFLGQSPADFRATAGRLFAADPWTLDALFPAARRRAVLRLLPRGSAAQRDYFIAWYANLRRLRAEPHCAQELAERLAAAPELGLSADSLPDIDIFREAVRAAALAFARAPAAGTLADLAHLLDSAEHAGLHLPLWEIQELAWSGVRRLKDAADAADIHRLVQILGIAQAAPPPPSETAAVPEA
ncbi:MAG: DUF3536 domain-containing protein [Elusimicrobiota bacterium]